MTIPERIDRFLSAEAFGVVGASAKPHKYGNKVLRCYLQNQQKVVPINPCGKGDRGSSLRCLGQRVARAGQ